MSSIASPRGFTLLETLVATGILVTALAGLAQLFILSTHLTRQANMAGAALVAAQSQLEVLGSLAFGYDAAGGAVTDPLLQPSPASSLDENAGPYVDWVDKTGQSHDSGRDTIFVRRWRVTPVDEGIPDSIAIEVCAFRMPAQGVAARSADACLSTIRTRQP
jgi:prepilin-type N-terminal cleavage/methylation domain-containing protein